jgi:hypothetical protein
MLAIQWAQTPPPVVIQWAGPDGRLYDELGDTPPKPVLTLVGPPGIQGPPGPADSEVVASIVTSADVVRGEPLAFNLATSQWSRADASNFALAAVVGLAEVDTLLGFPVDAVIGNMTLADWSAITGTVSLTPGFYFLAEGGGLTTAAPFTTGATVVQVGFAARPDTLWIDPQPRILL